MSLLRLRTIYPAVFDTGAYSCIARIWERSTAPKGLRLCSSTTSPHVHIKGMVTGEGQLTENDDISPDFINRNPRNLEQLGLAKKRKGWKFQYPDKQYYHRLLFERTNRYITGRVEHSSGKTVVSASTKEFAIAKHLYSFTDVSAAENVGRVLAQRCLESGIHCMKLQSSEHDLSSEKFQAFEKAVVEGGVDLCEPEEVKPLYEPGIDYDNQCEVEDLKRRQKLATQNMSEHAKNKIQSKKIMKFMKKNRHIRHDLLHK